MVEGKGVVPSNFLAVVTTLRLGSTAVFFRTTPDAAFQDVDFRSLFTALGNH